MPALTVTANGVVITVKVQPRASANAIAGIDDEWVRIRLQAPPVDGKANAALAAFLAKLLDCTKKDVTILTGDTSRIKRVLVKGQDINHINAKLGIT